MEICSDAGCVYFEDYQRFLDYYGDTRYADKWVLAATYGNDTAFLGGRGNADFSLLVGTAGRGRAEGMQTGTVALNMWMAVVRELEYAVRACRIPCTTNTSSACSDDAVHFLDTAAAFYAGSLEGQNGSPDGVLLHALADSGAAEFKTTKWAGNGEKGTAYVNLEIFYRLGEAQQALLDKNADGTGQCGVADAFKKEIINLMKVPLVQVVLSNAWIRAHDTEADDADVENAEAKGATYAAGILPYVYACNQSLAELVYNNLRIGSQASDVDFSSVKQAFEDVYECLGITCAEVGGIWNGTSYEPDAEPCTDGKVIVARFTEAPTSSPTSEPTLSPTSEPTGAPASVPSAPSPNSDSSTSSAILMALHWLVPCLNFAFLLAL
jgi:hypothetical protein